MAGPFHTSAVNLNAPAKITKGSPTSNGFWDSKDALVINNTSQKSADATTGYSNNQGIAVTSDINAFEVALAIQNKNAGTSATSDIIFYPDNATDVVNGPFFDIGIGSSTFSSPAYTVEPISAYAYTVGQSLTMGTGGNNDLVFHTNGTLAANERIRVKSAGQVLVHNQTAVTAGGATSDYIGVSSTAALGIYWGSGAPTVSAGQGSLYIRTDGSSTSTRMYINTTGSTTWTPVTTVG